MAYGAVRLGADTSMGHGCFPPSKTATGSTTVFADQLPQVRVSDMYAVHCCPMQGCHAPTVSQGSQTAFSENLAKHLLNHMCNCGDKAASGSMTTFAGF